MREVRARRPDLGKRVGREWMRLQYQGRRRDRTRRSVKEKIVMLEQVVASRGHTHRMLAGNPRLPARARKSLPTSLEAELGGALFEN